MCVLARAVDSPPVTSAPELDPFGAYLRDLLSFTGRDGEHRDLLAGLLEEAERLLAAPLDVLALAQWFCDLEAFDQICAATGEDGLTEEALRVGALVVERLRSPEASRLLAERLGGTGEGPPTLFLTCGLTRSGRPPGVSLDSASDSALLQLSSYVWGVPMPPAAGLPPHVSALQVPSGAVDALAALCVSSGVPEAHVLSPAPLPVLLETFAGVWSPGSGGPLSGLAAALESAAALVS